MKRAAIVWAIAPPLFALPPLHVIALGPRVAAVHLASGGMIALLLLDLFLLGYRKLPFASAYVPTSALKSAVYLSLFPSSSSPSPPSATQRLGLVE